MLFSTAFKLQAVSLYHYSDPIKSVQVLKDIAAKGTEPEAVKNLALLLADGGAATVCSMSPLEYLESFSEDAAHKEEPIVDDLGILEGIEADLLKAAAAGPLLPQQQALILQNLSDLEFNRAKDSIALIAEHNPAVAAQIIIEMKNDSALWQLASSSFSINLLSCWSSLLLRQSNLVDEAAVAAFISSGMHYLSTGEREKPRIAKLFCYFLDKIAME